MEKLQGKSFLDFIQGVYFKGIEYTFTIMETYLGILYQE